MRTNVHKSRKLLQTLHTKLNYTVHYHTLQLYVQRGLKITKVHRVLQFRQSNPMSHTMVSWFEQDFYKLMINSAYGKICESKRNRNRLFILRASEEVIEKVAKPTMSSFSVFGENLASVSFRPTKFIWTDLVLLERLYWIWLNVSCLTFIVLLWEITSNVLFCTVTRILHSSVFILLTYMRNMSRKNCWTTFISLISQIPIPFWYPQQDGHA